MSPVQKAYSVVPQLMDLNNPNKNGGCVAGLLASAFKHWDCPYGLHRQRFHSQHNRILRSENKCCVGVQLLNRDTFTCPDLVPSAVPRGVTSVVATPPSTMFSHTTTQAASYFLLLICARETCTIHTLNGKPLIITVHFIMVF